jgi:tetratricopeptide (TPR) repeat protein
MSAPPGESGALPKSLPKSLLEEAVPLPGEAPPRKAPSRKAGPPALPALPEPWPERLAEPLADPDPPPEPGGAWVGALCAAPGDPLAALWRPRDARPGAELGHVPFLFWLVDALRPRSCVMLGLGRGVACHALAQAAERLRLDLDLVAFARPGEVAALGPDYAEAAQAAAALHRVETTDPARAAERRRAPVDLLVATGDRAAALDAWRGRLSPGGVVLRLGGEGGRLRLPHSGGLAVDFEDCAPLKALAAAPDRAARLFERLGETIPGTGADDAAPRRTEEALAALGAALRERGALAERLGAEEREHRLARRRRDELWTTLHGLRRALGRTEEALRVEREALAEAREALAEAQASLEWQRAARARAEEAVEALEERRRRAALGPEVPPDPWPERRAAILSAEIRGRRVQRPWRPDPRRNLGQPSTRRQLAAIRASALFDPDWYRARNDDLGAADPARHYLVHGAAEGRAPGPGFDGRRYYVDHPDVAEHGWNPLVHYEMLGRDEGRAAEPLGVADARQDARLVEGSDLFDAEWYLERNPDVPPDMPPAEHFVSEGGPAGADPGPDFSTADYLEANPDVAASGRNALVHFLRFGRRERRKLRLGGAERREVDALRAQLLSLGFTEGPLTELEALASEAEEPRARERAAFVLARWHMRPGEGQDHAEALRWLERAAEIAATRDTGERVAVMRLACLDALRRREDAARLVADMRADGLGTPALTLASSVLEPDGGRRVARISEAMRAYGLPDVALRPEGDGATLYDRLRTAGEPPVVTDGPLVSVIVAAHDAEATLPLTLRALSEQTWRRHEVIVVDDASSDGTRAVAERFAERDGRVRVLPLERNVGAYAARNRGLAIARGELVCLQDADDWTHATRLEVQARHLVRHPERMACTVHQARLTDDLELAHFSSQGDLIFTSLASLMFRRAPVMRRLGGWDEVRFSADHELIRRIEDAFGRDTVERLATGPLTIQRYSEGSAIASPATGFNGAYFGARLEYFEAQRHHRRTGGALRYEPGGRPFPVPRIMIPDRDRRGARHLDVVIASEFRMLGGSVHSCIEELRAQRAAGLATGLVKMYRRDLPQPGRTDILGVVREEVDGEAVSVLTYGERATCDLLILRYPPVLQHAQRYLPALDPRRIKVIVNQPPMSDYGPEGRVRYDLARAEANLRAAFGRPGEWHPIGPLVREALHERHGDELGAIDLRPDDWINVLDVDEWDRGLGGGPRPDRSGPMRIGRHARDNAVKWPATREAVLEVYPAEGDVEVHVLGGQRTPGRLLRRIPPNWRVEPFGARPPQEFLAGLDVFVYYTHPDWVESFGRAIAEAMAAGVPCVLPPAYEAAFGDAATYAEPSGALAAARRLHGDPAAYRAQALRAQARMRAMCGYAHHIERLRAAGVRGAG